LLPAAIDIAEALLCYSYARELRINPLADSALGSRISDNSEELCIRLTEEVKSSRSALQVDEETGGVKEAHKLHEFRMCWKII
jgi:hypothetical protein